MRITQSIIVRNLLQGINRNRESMNSIQTSIATGREIRKPSDDPVRFTRASRFRKMISQNEQYIRNISSAQGWIDMSNGILEDLYSRTEDAKEIAIQGSDSSNNADNLALLGGQIDSILNELVSLANSSYLGKDLFSGTKTQEGNPFTVDGSAVSYTGNNRSITRKVSENLSVAINISGQKLMDTDIFTSLIDLRDALYSGDKDAVRPFIDTVDSVSDKLLSLLTAIGSIKNQLTMTEYRLETANINLSSFLSQTQDVDMLEAITKYNTEEMAYEAALRSSTHAIQLNLLDFLK